MNEYKGDTVEYQIGANDIDENTVLEGGETIQFEFENAAIFKRLADDIYESPEAGIREPIQNSLTAIKRAINEGYISKNEGVIEIEVRDGDRVSLVLQDNGIGISENVLNKVLTYIGRSQNRDNGEVSGKYGMGFLACYKLVGTNGGFIMHTNSRETNNAPYSGVWKPGLFEKDTQGSIPVRFGQNDYGTRFEFTLKEDISIDNVRNWVEKHAKWATIPIIYREFDKNNELEYDDEFGIKKLQEAHKNTNFTVTIDNDYYTAICSQNKEGRTLLINSPINRNSSYESKNVSLRNVKHPSNMDIRLKNENGIIVKGPHKGLMPISEGEYKNLSEDRKENYIPEKKLNTPNTEEDVMKDNIDIKLPQPTGTRDTLERDAYFWIYLQNRMIEEIKSIFKDYMSDINNIDDLLNLSTEKRTFIINTISILNISLQNKVEITANISAEFGIQISDDLARFFKNIKSEEYYVKRNSSAYSASKKGDDSNVEKTVGDIIANTDSDGKIFMGVSMNQTKMNAVWEENENNVIVRVKKSYVYDTYSELYGWKELRNIKEHIDEDSISEHTRQLLFKKKSKSSSSVKNKDIKNREINIHKNNTNDKKYVSSIYNEYNKNDSETLVLFLSNSDYNLSDYYNIISDDVSTANSLVKIWDYLKDAQNITKIEDWMDTVSNYSFETSDGIYTSEELSQTDKTILFHVTDTNADIFREKQIMNEMRYLPTHSTVKDNKFSYNKLEEINPTEILYVPLSSTKLNHLNLLFDTEGKQNNVYTINTENKEKIGNIIKISYSDIYWYVWSKLPEWRNSDKINTLKSSNYSLTNEWIELVDNICQSESSVSIDNLPNPNTEFKYQTNDGKKSLRELDNEYEVIIAHIVEPEISLLFRDDNIINDIKSYVYNNETPKYNSYRQKKRPDAIRKDYNINEVVYIPITRGEYRNLKNGHKSVDNSILYTISKETVYSRCKSNIPIDSAAYAYAILSDELYNVIIPEEPSEMKELMSGGLEFINSIKNIE